MLHWNIIQEGFHGQPNLCYVVIYTKHLFFSLTGQGFYCHLYGLRDLAISKDQELHSLYIDGDSLNGFTLSTSSTPNPSFRVAVFAPDVPDGFGIHYWFQDNTINYNITSYVAGSHQEFSRCVYKSLEDIFTVLEEKTLGSISK